MNTPVLISPVSPTEGFTQDRSPDYSMTTLTHIEVIMTMNISTMHSNTMSFEHDSFASVRAEESFYLSVVLTMAAVLAFCVIIKMFLIASVASLNLNPKSNDTNQVDLAKSIITKVSTDEVAIILSYLPRKEIMRARVCKLWRDAAKETIVPMYEDVEQNLIDFEYGLIFHTNNKYGFRVDGLMSYYAMTVFTSALPCLQQLTIGCLGNRRTFSVGEDPDEERAAQIANNTIYDMNLISNFSKLRILRLDSSDLNGRYPTLFNFPLLQQLIITSNCRHLKWDFEMLSGCPSLEELECESDLTENISSLRTLKNTLQKLTLSKCFHIHGNFMVLADFPRLKEMYLEDTAVTGDIRHIGEGDFPSLATFLLPSTVIGGMNYEFQRISDVTDFMRSIHSLLGRPHLPATFALWEYHLNNAFGWKLSSDSPDWYRPDEESDNPLPPLCLRIIRAGPYVGWCWCSHSSCDYYHCCYINGLIPPPNKDSDDYETFIKEFSRILQCYPSEFDTYKGYGQKPPTEEEYQRLFEE